MESVFIIIPAYNEGDVIKETLRGLLNYRYKIIVIDDGSNDRTMAQISDMPIYYLKHSSNLGQGAAIQTGVEFARKKGARYFVTFDADGQHDPEDIKQMLGHLIYHNLDIVIGSRFLNGAKTNINLIRKVLLKFAILINYVFSRILLSDAHNGLRVFNLFGAAAFNFNENKMAHATELMININELNLKYAEYPVHITYSTYSKQKGQSTFSSIKIIQDLILYKILK